MKLALLGLLLLFAAQTRADVLFQLSSLRSQGVNNCWAYAAANMSEAYLQHRSGISVPQDVESSAYYLNVRERLLNSFRTKKISDMVEDPRGYATNYFQIMAKYGMGTFAPKLRLNKFINAYPDPTKFLIPMLYKPLHFNAEVRALERTLVNSSMSESEAEQLIDDTMGRPIPIPDDRQTHWAHGTIPIRDLYFNVFGEKPQAFGPYTFVVIQNASDRIVAPENGWFTVDDGRTSVLRISDNDRILSLARLSMDRGWPMTLHGRGHYMTLLGYKKISQGVYSYAIVDTGGVVLPPGVNWVNGEYVKPIMMGITVKYSVLADQLPPPPDLRTSVQNFRVPLLN